MSYCTQDTMIATLFSFWWNHTNILHSTITETKFTVSRPRPSRPTAQTCHPKLKFFKSQDWWRLNNFVVVREGVKNTRQGGAWNFLTGQLKMICSPPKNTENCLYPPKKRPPLWMFLAPSLRPKLSRPRVKSFLEFLHNCYDFLAFANLYWPGVLAV